MISGIQSLESILKLARTRTGALDATFDVPVLLLVSEEAEYEAVTAVGSVPTTEVSGDSRTTLVIPIQARAPAPGQPQLSFGRSTVCDIMIPVASVSKHHGYFQAMAQGWLVSDVGSTNGTSVEGQPVTKSGTPLTDGCSLRLGRVLAQFLSAKSFCDVLRQRLAAEP